MVDLRVSVGYAARRVVIHTGRAHMMDVEATVQQVIRSLPHFDSHSADTRSSRFLCDQALRLDHSFLVEPRQFPIQLWMRTTKRIFLRRQTHPAIAVRRLLREIRQQIRCARVADRHRATSPMPTGSDINANISSIDTLFLIAFAWRNAADTGTISERNLGICSSRTLLLG